MTKTSSEYIVTLTEDVCETRTYQMERDELLDIIEDHLHLEHPYLRYGEKPPLQL